MEGRVALIIRRNVSGEKLILKFFKLSGPDPAKIHVTLSGHFSGTKGGWLKALGNCFSQMKRSKNLQVGSSMDPAARYTEG